MTRTELWLAAVHLAAAHASNPFASALPEADSPEGRRAAAIFVAWAELLYAATGKGFKP